MVHSKSKESKARMLIRYTAYMKKKLTWTNMIRIQSEKLVSQKSVLVIKTRQMHELKIKMEKTMAAHKQAVIACGHALKHKNHAHGLMVKEKRLMITAEGGAFEARQQMESDE